MSKKWILILCALAVGAQQQPATFRTNTNLVVVNVTVRDKSGKLIENLTKEDFTILEDDKPQVMSVFQKEQLSSDPLPSVAPQQLKTRTPAPATPSPTEAASRPSLKDRRLLAFFFDMSAMQPAEQIRAKEAALKFLDEQMTSADLVTVLTFSNRLRVVEDFTDDRERLRAAINSFRIGESSDLAVDGLTGADDTDDSGAFTADDTEFNIFNTDRKLSALETAAKQLGAFSEKKALIYFSSGISKTGMENQSQLRSTVNAAVRANVAFYPIDARGLIAAPPGGDASVASPRGTGIFTAKAQRAGRDKINDQQETLDTLAADTGGKALLDNNDLSVGIRQAQKDISTYYLLGYYSTNGALDGRFRKIKVKLNPALQAKLDYRNGYYAQKQFNKFTASDKERQLEEALTLGNPMTDLPLVLEIDYFRIARDKYFIPISVKIPGSAIDLSKRSSTDFDFIGQIRDSSGKLITGVRDGISMKLKEGAAAQLSRKQLQYDTGIVVAPGDYRLIFLARENQTGKMGTFETKFNVPDLGKQAAGSMRMSSVIWSNQREALTASVGSAGTSKKLLAMHPLVQDGQKIVPSITRVFRKDQKMYVYFEVYDSLTETDQKLSSVAAELTMYSGSRKAFESSPIRMTRTATNRPNTVAFQFQLPLTNLQPGRYVAQVNVIDELAKKFGFVRAPFVIQ